MILWGCGPPFSPLFFTCAKCKEEAWRWKDSKDRRRQAEGVRQKGGVNKGSRIGKERRANRGAAVQSCC